jgi:hypothetical protein
MCCSDSRSLPSHVNSGSPAWSYGDGGMQGGAVSTKGPYSSTDAVCAHFVHIENATCAISDRVVYFIGLTGRRVTCWHLRLCARPVGPLANV